MNSNNYPGRADINAEFDEKIKALLRDSHSEDGYVISIQHICDLPTMISAWSWLGEICAATNRLEEAMRISHYLEILNPSSPAWSSVSAQPHRPRGRFGVVGLTVEEGLDLLGWA